MSRQRPRLCAAVRSKSSSFLDGRLSAESRRIVQQHLNDCSECMHELQAVAKLSRATHNLPQHRAPSDMAGRVRQGLARQRGEAIAKLPTEHSTKTQWRSRAVLAAAAAVFITTGWTAGFWMGKATHPDPSATPPQVAAPRPLIDVDSFRLASHNVLQDLAIAPSLPEHAQQPLIAAQLAYFDLPKRARPILRAASPSSIEHRLALFVTELDEAISLHASMDWMHWHERAEQRGLLEPSRSAPVQFANLPPNVRANTIVDRFPAQLDNAERQSLAEFLVLKHELLAGEVTTSLGLIEQWQSTPDQPSTFALASGSASTRSLLEVGRPDDAKRMFRAMRTQVRMNTLKTTTGKGNKAMRNLAAEMLERMMRELGIDPNAPQK